MISKPDTEPTLRGHPTDHDCGHRDSPAAHGGHQHRPGRRSHTARDGRRQPGPPTTEAAFAALCGVSPVEASSGKTHRLRLNQGGDRQANAALFRAVLIRLRWHVPTWNYLQGRTAEGLTEREVIRCLKRYLARTIYKIIIASKCPLPS